MQFSLSFAAALVAVASASPLDRRASPLSATLAQLENSVVQVSLTNTGSSGYNLLAGGTILDEDPVEKVYVSSANATVEFLGINKRVILQDLPAEAFIAIAAGETITRDIEVAELYDLSAGGVFDVVAVGVIPYAEEGSTTLVSSGLLYSTEILALEVDGAAAEEVSLAVRNIKRSIVQNDCSGTRRTAVVNGLRNCATQSSRAATAASSGPIGRFQTFFRTTAASNRQQVSARFSAIARDCSTINSGVTRTFCNDPYAFCRPGVLAYAVPRDNNINYCPQFYSLPAVTGTCYRQDQVGTVIHEETHAPAVYSPHTVDYAYGFAASTRLTAAQALLNADSYTLFSNAVALNC